MLDAFADTATTLAASSNRMASTSATPEQVDLVADLGELTRAILDHNQRVLMGDDVDWARLAERLAAAADRCHRQVVVVTQVMPKGGANEMSGLVKVCPSCGGSGRNRYGGQCTTCGGSGSVPAE